MPRYKPCDYAQSRLIPVALSSQLQPGTLEYAIHYLLEERLDLSAFDQRYQNEEVGRRAYAPKVLLKVILLAYARGMLSSRQIERACRENVVFMALACEQAPDHSTLAEFLSSIHQEVPALFTQVLLVCEQEGLLGGTHFSLDGVKLPSNAAKECSGTFADLRLKQQALEGKVREAVAAHRAADQLQEPPPASERQRQQQRIERLRQKAERIEKFLAENEPKCGGRGQEIQSNVTDNDSAKMVSAHGVIQGYNGNAVVEQSHQVVVYAEAFGAGDDGEHLAPMVVGAQRNLAAVGQVQPLRGRPFSADTGYYSLENLQAAQEHGLDAYIPDRHFRQRDVRFAQAGRYRRATDRHKRRYRSTRRWFGPDDFRPEPERGGLICPAGHRLYRNGMALVTRNGYRVSSFRALRKDCNGCRLRARCLRNLAPGSTRQVRLFHGRVPGSLTEAMKQKIDTPEGRACYSQRLGIVEPVFGNIRAQKGMDRFTLRGRIKVNTQWLLYCLVHNIGKLVGFTECSA